MSQPTEKVYFLLIRANLTLREDWIKSLRGQKLENISAENTRTDAIGKIAIDSENKVAIDPEKVRNIAARHKVIIAKAGAYREISERDFVQAFREQGLQTVIIFVTDGDEAVLGVDVEQLYKERKLHIDPRAVYVRGFNAVQLKELATELLSEGEALQTERENTIKKILIADDDPAIRELTEEALNIFPVAVTKVASGAEALEALQSDVFDMIVLDDQMGTGKMTGTEVFLKMRSEKNNTPVLFASGTLNPNESLGPHIGRGLHFIKKPWDLAVFRTKVAEILRMPVPEVKPAAVTESAQQAYPEQSQA